MPIRIKNTRILSDDYYLLKKTTFELERRDGHSTSAVMPALGAGIHEFVDVESRKSWMPGTSPGMTRMNLIDRG